MKSGDRAPRTICCSYSSRLARLVAVARDHAAVDDAFDDDSVCVRLALRRRRGKRKSPHRALAELRTNMKATDWRPSGQHVGLVVSHPRGRDRKGRASESVCWWARASSLRERVVHSCGMRQKPWVGDRRQTRHPSRPPKSPIPNSSFSTLTIVLPLPLPLSILPFSRLTPLSSCSSSPIDLQRWVRPDSPSHNRAGPLGSSSTPCPPS